jgi:hypothetical protein
MRKAFIEKCHKSNDGKSSKTKSSILVENGVANRKIKKLVDSGKNDRSRRSIEDLKSTTISFRTFCISSCDAHTRIFKKVTYMKTLNFLVFKII